MIMRVCVQSQAIKGKNTGIGGQVALALLFPKNQHTCMSADPNTPLFVLSNGDNVEYKEDPTVAQAKANLAAAERIQ